MKDSRFSSFIAACTLALAFAMAMVVVQAFPPSLRFGVARQRAERGGGRPAASTEAVDKIFSKWNASTPGCAVGVATDGKPVLAKAYGMADLEHDVKNTPET